MSNRSEANYVEMKISQSALFGKILDFASRILTDHVNVYFSQSGFFLSSMDAAHVVMLYFEVPKASCLEYKLVGTNIRLGWNLKSTSKLISHWGNGTWLKIGWCNTKPDDCTIQFGDEVDPEKTDGEFDIRLMTIEDDLYQIPEYEYVQQIVMPSSTFAKIMRSFVNFCEVCLIHGYPDTSGNKNGGTIAFEILSTSSDELRKARVEYKNGQQVIVKKESSENKKIRTKRKRNASEIDDDTSEQPATNAKEVSIPTIKAKEHDQTTCVSVDVKADKEIIEQLDMKRLAAIADARVGSDMVMVATHTSGPSRFFFPLKENLGSLTIFVAPKLPIDEDV